MRQLYRTSEGYGLRNNGVLDLIASPLSSPHELIEAVDRKPFEQRQIRFEGARLLAPVTPAKVVLVGLNYLSHAEEAGQPPPAALIYGGLAGDPVVATGGTTRLPSIAPDEVDYEGEIGVVIGRSCVNVEPEEAHKYVLGLTAVIDLSARDVQMQAIAAGNQGPTMQEAKGYPGFKPIGPGILLTDGARLDDLDLALETRINSEVRQSARSTEMIFPFARIVSEISKVIPLAPGDVISTGTPGGVGFIRKAFLRSGDEIAVTIGNLPPLTCAISD